MEEEVIDHPHDKKKQEIQVTQVTQVNQSTENMEAHWVQAIDDLYLSKIHVKKKGKETIQGIGNA
jgi:hypothetical protein